MRETSKDRNRVEGRGGKGTGEKARTDRLFQMMVVLLLLHPKAILYTTLQIYSSDGAGIQWDARSCLSLPLNPDKFT